jgi:hypothetical protein
MRPSAPSQDSSIKDKLFNFLADVNCRFFYNKILNLEKEVQKIIGKNLFLETCIEESIIPDTFKISNQPQDNLAEEEWKDKSIEASKGFMRAAINANNIKIQHISEIHLLKHFANPLHVISSKKPLPLELLKRELYSPMVLQRIKLKRLNG